MRRSWSIATSAVVAAFLTHGMVLSAMCFNDSVSVSAYQRFFRHVALATEWLWSFAHGWTPMSHIRDFGRFYAPVVQLTCPLIGFALFCILSRHRVGFNFWKPMAIALLLAIPSGYTALVPASATPWVEAARAILVVLLMVWSVGAIRISIRPGTGLPVVYDAAGEPLA